MPTTSPATATCERCNGTGQYHGTRRDGTSYIGRCFACQGYQRSGHRSYRTGTVAAPTVPVTITPRMAAFQAQYPAEFAWLQANSAAGVGFASSLLAGMARYGGLTPRQLAAVQRNLGQVEPVATAAVNPPDVTESLQSQIAETGTAAVVITPPAPPAPVTIDMSQIFAAFDAAAASGLRKVRLTLGDIELRRTGERFRHGSGNVMIYLNGQYRGYVSRDNVFHLGVGRVLTPTEADHVRAAVADPQSAARTHGLDSNHCSCCGKLLTDPVSTMTGIGPICLRRYFPSAAARGF